MCALQQQLDLTDEERTLIGWRKIRLDENREYVAWNPVTNGSIEPRNYELVDADVQRLCRAVDQFRVVLGRDRSWWQPLVAQLPLAAEANGKEA